MQVSLLTRIKSATYRGSMIHLDRSDEHGVLIAYLTFVRFWTKLLLLPQLADQVVIVDDHKVRSTGVSAFKKGP